MLNNKIKHLPITILATATLFTSSLFAAGEVKDGKVSTYLRGAFQETNAVESKLKSGGFEILGTSKTDGSTDMTTVIFTCPTLKALGNKATKGFAGALRVLVNKKDNQISFTNPLYFEKAFLQKDFDEDKVHKVLDKINATFPGLQNSKDSMTFKKLAKYHFMFGMPYYEDMDKVAKGTHDTLLQKIKAYNGGKNIAFSFPLATNRTLIGFNLSANTAKFIQKIGTKNAALLPYPILIEEDRAKILAPKYYIALSYPQLKMSQFMKISDIPGKIEKECALAFK